MAITIKADDRVSEALPDEEVYLPGPRPGDDDEGPFPFVYPRIGKLISMQRRLKGLDMAAATAEQLDGMRQWLAAGFGPDAWAHINARLERSDDVALLYTGDPEEVAKYDLLDDEHMAKLFELLNEGHTGRPTTSSSGASRQPWKNNPPAAPSPLASVSAT
jgi:hypothetical protein